MAAKYAKDQPAGFTNKIEKVAIVGAGGTMGRFFAESLLKTGKHTVTAISRAGSNNKLPEGIKTVFIDYDDEDSIVDALKGQQFLIITMNARAPPTVNTKLHQAAAKAGVPWVMPNCYGQEPKNDAFGKENMVGIDGWKHVQEIKKLGVSSSITFCCGFWYEFSLGGSPQTYGFDFTDRKVIFFDDGNAKINTSTWDQCGRGIAALLSLKELPEDENDTSPTLSRWRDDTVYIGSFTVSQRDMFESVKRVTNTTDADWDITYESTRERYQKALEALGGGDRFAFRRALYTRVFYPDGASNSEAKYGLANEALGLPKEDFDERTKEGIRMGLAGEGAAYQGT